MYVEYLIANSTKIYKEYDIINNSTAPAQLEQYWAGRGFVFLGITKAEDYNQWIKNQEKE